MVYRRRNVKRKTKSPWYKRKYNAMQLAAKAWRSVKYIKGLVNSEMLHKDFTYSVGTLIANTGFVTHLTGIAQDDTIAGRTGNSLLLRNLTYRYKLEVNASVTSNTTILMILFRDNQQISDTTPAITDILTSSTTESLLATGNFGRFKILSRKVFTLTPASGGNPAREITGYFNLQKHIRYNGIASTDIQKNGHYIAFLSSENTNYPTIVGSARIGYHDN